MSGLFRAPVGWLRGIAVRRSSHDAARFSVNKPLLKNGKNLTDCLRCNVNNVTVENLSCRFVVRRRAGARARCPSGISHKSLGVSRAGPSVRAAVEEFVGPKSSRRFRPAAFAKGKAQTLA